ncbi:MAG: class I SAM-dependent methyltransferase [Desulfobacterales bacterium]|nr:class I SAM-dependent methyltransferase [Desulfobacterales bacterium]
MITVDFGRLNIKRGDCILDIGCGQGRHTCAVYDQDKANLIVGADANINDLYETQHRLTFHQELEPHSITSWALSSADITHLPFKDHTFDMVICSEVLEHIADDNQAACELIRVLKPGCILVISVPRYYPECICWKLSYAYFHSPGGHIRIYTQQSIISLFKTKGLTLTHVHYAHSFHTPYWWLKCLLGLNRTNRFIIKLYHHFLVWEMIKKPKITAWLDWLLNPILGKSLVLYFIKSF